MPTVATITQFSCSNNMWGNKVLRGHGSTHAKPTQSHHTPNVPAYAHSTPTHSTSDLHMSKPVVWSGHLQLTTKESSMVQSGFPTAVRFANHDIFPFMVGPQLFSPMALHLYSHTCSLKTSTVLIIWTIVKC